jgi:hypothetical protein
MGEFNDRMMRGPDDCDCYMDEDATGPRDEGITESLMAVAVISLSFLSGAGLVLLAWGLSGGICR